MNTQRNIPWWAAMRRRRREAAATADFADMGTAFGLDASLQPCADAEPPRRAEAASIDDRLNRRSVL